MAAPYDFSLPQEPVDECLNKQTDHQLERNYAQGTHNVYELSDAQFDEVYKLVAGSGNFFTGDWVESRPVTINGEALMWLKQRGDHVRIIVPAHT
ncbi:hypothetical protein ACXX83_06475 [Pseudomonas sp. GNP012]|jgi:hypothetical protein